MVQPQVRDAGQQNATGGDLVLLGALPTVALAGAAAILLDAVIDASRLREQRP